MLSFSGYLWRLHQLQKGLLTVMYKGATEAGALAKAFAALARPIVIKKLLIAVAAQKILAPVCSRAAA